MLKEGMREIVTIPSESTTWGAVSYTHLDVYKRQQRHLRYLKEYRKVTYINLLTNGRLNDYLTEIDRQAQERFERLIEQMKQIQGITEQLKSENAIEWIERINNIRICAMEIVEKEIIYA